VRALGIAGPRVGEVVRGQSPAPRCAAAASTGPKATPQVCMLEEMTTEDIFSGDSSERKCKFAGGDGGIIASGAPLHGLPPSASITIRPRAVVVFGVS
jgi:hypothetical protein